MCGLIFPRQNIASALHPFQQNRPIPLFLLIVRTVFPDLPQQVFFGCFIYFLTFFRFIILRLT